MSDVVVNLVLNDKQFKQILKANEKTVEAAAKHMAKSIDQAAKKTAFTLAGLQAALKFVEKGFNQVVRGVREVVNWLVKLADQGMPKEFDRLTAAGTRLEKALARSASHSGALKSGLDALTSAADTFVNIFSSENGQKVINKFFGSISVLLADTIDAFLGAKKMFSDFERAKSSAAESVIATDGPLVGPAAGVAYIMELLNPRPFKHGAKRRMIRSSLDAPSAEEQSMAALEKLANELRAAGNNGLIPSRGIRGGKPENKAETVASGNFANELFRIFGLGALPQIAEFSGERLRIMGLQEDLNSRTRAASEQAGDRLGFSEQAREMVDALNAPVAAIMEFQKPAREGLQGLKDVFVDGITEITEESQPILEMIRDSFTSAFTDLFVGMAEDIASGTFDALSALGSFLGSILKQIGTMLIHLGSAGLAAATLGSFIPFLKPVTGGPAGIGASLAAIATGGVLLGVGTALSSGGGDGGAASASAGAPRIPGGAGGPSGARINGFNSFSGVPAGGVSSGRVTPESNTFVINFNEPVLGAGDPDRLGRYLSDAINRNMRRTRPGSLGAR